MTIPTDTQYRYMAYIDLYMRRFDNSPSMKEMAQSFGVNPNAARDNCVALEKKGYLKKVPGRQCYQRTIKFKQFMASWPKGEAA